MKDLIKELFDIPAGLLGKLFSPDVDWEELVKHADDCEKLSKLIVDMKITSEGNDIKVECDDTNLINDTIDTLGKLKNLFVPIFGEDNLEKVLDALSTKRNSLTAEFKNSLKQAGNYITPSPNYGAELLDINVEQYNQIEKLANEYAEAKGDAKNIWEYMKFAAWLLNR